MPSRHKILIIDYEPKSVQKVQGLLEQAGYEVHVAPDGLAGIAAFLRIKPNLTLIEAMIPKKHGFEVCQELKQTPHGKATPILIVTSVYKGRKYRTQALHNYGCNEYIEKPISDEKLLEIVRLFLHEPDAESMPGPSAAASENRAGEGSDAAELEIMERLDQILPDDAPPSSPVARSEDEKVVSFDPERYRRRRMGHAAAPSTPIQSKGSPGIQAQSAVKPSRLDPLDDPDVATEVDAAVSPNALPPPSVGDATGAQGGKLWIWMVLLITGLLILGGAVAYFILMT